MVVKLYFSDGSSVIRSFNDEELLNLKLLDKLKEYFIKKFNPFYSIDSYELFDIKNCSADAEIFDLREYFNYSQSFIGMEMGGLVVGFEFFERGSFEFFVDSIEADSYQRAVIINYTFDNYPLNKFNFDPENW